MTRLRASERGRPLRRPRRRQHQPWSLEKARHIRGPLQIHDSLAIASRL